jgi:hypothetical protein
MSFCRTLIFSFIVRPVISRRVFRDPTHSLRQWFEATVPKLSRKSDTTAAIRYALSRWDALLHYIEDGNVEIDNNAVGLGVVTMQCFVFPFRTGQGSHLRGCHRMG